MHDLTPQEVQQREHANYIQRMRLIVRTYEKLGKQDAPHVELLRQELAAALSAGDVTLYDEHGAEVAS